MKYRVTHALDIDEITEQVNGWITLGWKPQGGVSVTVIRGNLYYAQAMVKDDD